MKFRDYAANETSLLASRLLAKRSKRSVGDLQAFRQVLDDAARAFEEALASSAKIDHDEEISEIVDRLTSAAAAQAQALTQREKAEAQTVIEAVRKEIEAARKELEDHSRTKAALDGELKNARKELEEHARAKAALDGELKGSRKEAEEHARAKTALDGELKGARKELEEQARARTALDGELKGTRKELDAQARAKNAVDGELKTARKEVEDHARAKAAVDGELKNARKDLEAQTRAKAAVDGELKESRAAQTALDRGSKELRAGHAAQTALLDRAKADLDRAKADNERARREWQSELDASVASEAMLRQRIADAERDIEHTRRAAQAAAHDATLAAAAGDKSATLLLDRLLTVSQSMAAVTSIDDVMAALIEALASDFARVAHFRVKGNRLEGVHQVGFDFKNDISKVAIPLTMDSLVTRAVASDRVEAFAARELADNVRPPLGGDPDSALALPIKVHEETLAVIYAEDASHSPGDSAAFGQWAKVAELVRRQAVPVLEKLSVEPKVLAELRAYATLLLDEIEHMYTSEVSQGKKSADLKNGLKANLQCAREIYGQRVASQGPRAATVLDERLATVLEARASTPFGKDLAAIAGKTSAAPEQRSSRVASQAS